MNPQRTDPPIRPPSPSRSNAVLLGFLVIIGFFLIAEHRAHLLGILPWLLLLACPLMHLFMHHGHGGAHASHHDAVHDKAKTPETEDKP
ncbi:DUF2933 family protein [Plasticicumulans lactativorans]|uniref:DUF2933 family protein n=1 Tax=Plasticicumulans lactativorans TaxID=1133106 RepID=A0A4R2L8X9_9GAMM|nr:DUF2933 domain-containing protein [Plasticicumulans lactativorans]TCO80689.1 DUF2933 family protein [Plasticicumulans lactativorans]